MCFIMVYKIYIFGKELFPNTGFQHRQHEYAVGCRTFCGGLNRMLVFDIQQIPGGYIQICNWCNATAWITGLSGLRKNYENAE